MPLPRMTIRRGMLAVAVSAGIAAGFVRWFGREPRQPSAAKVALLSNYWLRVFVLGREVPLLGVLGLGLLILSGIAGALVWAARGEGPGPGTDRDRRGPRAGSGGDP